MADKWPLASGNYSTAANWNGGTLPVDGDVVYADNRTITIDQNISLPNCSFRTTARSGGTAGGSFSVSSGTYSITVLEAIAGATAVFTISNTVAITWTNILFRGSDTAANGWGLQLSGGGVQTFVNCVATGGNFGVNAHGINNSQPATLLTGTLSLVNGSATQAPALSMSGTNTHNYALTGACVHGLQRTVVLGGSGTYTFTSETTTGASGASAKITILDNSTSTITRNDASTILAFPNAWTAIHFSLGTNSVLNYTGNKQQSNGEIVVLFSAGAVFRHTGTLYGPDAVYGSIAIATAALAGAKAILDKLARNATSGLMPSLGNGWYLKSTSQIVASTESSTVTLVSSASAGDYPSAANVRSGTSYAYGALTGTCAVPAAGSVASGVSVDATTGTATLTAANVRSAVGMSSANLDTQLGIIAGYIDTEVAAIKSVTDQMRFTVPNQLDANALSGGTSAVAVRQEMDSNSTKLAAIKAKTDLIGSASAATSLLAGAVLDPGTITSFPETLTVGDSYQETDGREIQIPLVDTDGNVLTTVGTRTLSSATATFEIRRINESDPTKVITGTATIVDPPGTGTGAGAPYAIVQLPASETSKGLVGYRYKGKLVLTWNGPGTDVYSFDTDTIKFQF